MGPIKIRFSNDLPEYGFSMNSLPYLWYPVICKAYAFYSVLKGLNGVASSLNFPLIAASFATKH